MLWAVLSLTSAFSLATADALTKRVLNEHDEYMVAWFRLLLTLPFLMPFLLFIELPKVDSHFYSAFFIALPLEVLATILYIKALKSSPLSLTLPFLSLTPVFLIAFSYLILGEKVSIAGGLGILLIAGGSYMLNFHQIGRGLLEPFRAVLREKGSILMAITALIYSVTASLGKVAIMHSSPVFFGVTYYIVLTALFSLFMLFWRRHGNACSDRKGMAKAMLIPCAFNSIMVLTHMIAVSLINVAYMIAVKRTNIIFGVIYGYLLFKDKDIGERSFGAALMFIGFVLIVLAS